MINPLIKKYATWVDLSAEEKDALMALSGKRELISSGTEILRAGQNYKFSYIVEEGWLSHFKLLADGRQQILNFSLPGDFMCLDATVIKTTEHSINAITDVIVSQIVPEKILDLFSQSPRLAAILCLSKVHENSILAEQIVRVGRRNAYESIAHLLLEFLRRLDLIGKAESNVFDFPLTQEQIADTLGLTTVHVNRTIRKLKNDRLIEYSDHKMIILDLKKLRQIAGSDPVHLEQNTLSHPKNQTEAV